MFCICTVYYPASICVAVVDVLLWLMLLCVNCLQPTIYAKTRARLQNQTLLIVEIVRDFAIDKHCNNRVFLSKWAVFSHLWNTLASEIHTVSTRCTRRLVPVWLLWKFTVDPEQIYTEHCAACFNQTQTARVYPNADSSQETRGLDPMLFQCWPSAVGGGPILKQHWVKSSCLLGAPHRCQSTPTPPLHNILASRSVYF